jgi:hypothetical protein
VGRGRSRIGLGAVLLLVAIVAVGCSRGDPQGRRAITGTVTLDGTPLAKGNIQFQSDQPSGPTTGAVIAAGKFSIPTEKGLPPGKYRVRIFATKPGTGEATPGTMPGEPIPPAEEMIPPEYNSQSENFVDVTEKGPNDFKFEVVTKK